jgi:hypothetical protein
MGLRFQDRREAGQLFARSLVDYAWQVFCAASARRSGVAHLPPQVCQPISLRRGYRSFMTCAAVEPLTPRPAGSPCQSPA